MQTANGDSFFLVAVWWIALNGSLLENHTVRHTVPETEQYTQDSPCAKIVVFSIFFLFFFLRTDRFSN